MAASGASSTAIIDDKLLVYDDLLALFANYCLQKLKLLFKIVLKNSELRDKYEVLLETWERRGKVERNGAR